jgi:hypothetical protein
MVMVIVRLLLGAATGKISTTGWLSRDDHSSLDYRTLAAYADTLAELKGVTLAETLASAR